MNNLCKQDKENWNRILKSASLELLEVTIAHCEKALVSLRIEEDRAREQISLSALQTTELKLFEEKRTTEVCETKRKKFTRDGITDFTWTNLIIPEKVSGTEIAAKNCPPITSSYLGQEDNIINLSSRPITAEERSILSRGLTFCPTTGKYNEFSVLKDLDNFARTLRLREYFFDRTQGSSDSREFGITNQHWTPNLGRDKYLDMYITAVQNDVIRAYKSQKPGRQNLSRKERDALEALSKRTDVVIKPADKGGGIVVMDKDKYLEEGIRQLSNTQFYQHLEADPTPAHQKFVADTLDRLAKDGDISKRLCTALTAPNPSPGRFYMLPKIHKKGNPGRPIVSGIGTITEMISAYIETLIGHIPATHPSHIRDTNHFLREIADLKLPEGAFLVTMDVVSLYTNIPHVDGTESLIRAYKKHRKEDSPSTDVLETLTKLVLEYNNFEFDNEHYLQINGTAMGTRMAPTYANIFMHSIESKFLLTCPIKPTLYKRYLDDIFLIWTNTEKELLNFIQNFNLAHPNISFTESYSSTKVNFLDVEISVEKGSLITNVYRKPTDRQQYLHFKSCHPRHSKTSIPYSQAHRFKRICSQDQDFTRNTNRMREVLIKQRYPPAIVDDAIQRASELRREEVLEGRGQSEKVDRRTSLVLTFTSSHPDVNKILNKHFNILEQSERLSKIFTTPPRVVYRRPKNIRNILVHSKTDNRPRVGCRPCGKTRCQVCNHIQTSSCAISTASSFKWTINGNFDCDASNVVYLLECGVCNMQYIGQTTTPLRIRFNNHRAHVRSQPNLPFSKHINQKNHSFDLVKLTVLQGGFSNTREREQRESYFIYKFGTIGNGINENMGAMSSIRALQS